MKKLSLDELNRITVDEFKEASKNPICILLDNVRSLHNVGSAFRTADAFRIHKIILAGITGTPPHREIHKTALGATESVSWEYAPKALDAVKGLKIEGYKIIIVEQTSASQPLHSFTPSALERYCLVFGNEINGVDAEVVSEGDLALEIPQSGTKHSLNISVCVGIVVWDISQKLNALQVR